MEKQELKKLIENIGMEEILYCLADIIKEKQEQKPTIGKIWIEHILDDCPDTSFYGKYADQLDDGVIVREFDEFWENLDDEQKEDAENTRSREYRGFKPYAGEEKEGTEDYYKYGLQDYERMEKLNKGDFCFIGIVANCKVKYPIGQGSFRLENFSSSGLWGIESDSGKDYLDEVGKDELENLKFHLEKMNINTSNFDELAKDAEIKNR